MRVFPPTLAPVGSANKIKHLDNRPKNFSQISRKQYRQSTRDGASLLNFSQGRASMSRCMVRLLGEHVLVAAETCLLFEMRNIKHAGT
jgi:hypothetical protein